jgi:glycosyltransferase involved in cell wall biosynthesis
MVLAGLYPKMTGAKLILDIHDIVPELFASKFGATKNGQYVRLLKTIEKMATASVDHVIVSNHLWHEKLIARVVPEEKTSVIVNHVDPAIFHRRRRSRNDGKFIVLFPGTFQWHQGIDLAIEAFAGVKQRVPNAEFHIYGDGTERAKLVRLTEQLKLTECVKFFGYLPLEQIAEVMSNADLGVVPKRANSFGNEAYSTKIMEFMSQGVPVVISRTKIDSFYFDNSVVEFFTSGDIQSLTDAIMRVVEDKARREELIRHGYEYVDRNSWASKERDYYDLVDSLSVEVFDNPGQPVTQS